MSRSGYSDDIDDILMLGRWRGMVTSATRGKRGHKLFKDLLEALDAMPVKELIDEVLEDSEGVCALGCLGKKRGLDMTNLDPEEPELVAKAFDIAPCLAQEIVFENDEAGPYGGETPSERWIRIRKWVSEQIKRGIKMNGKSYRLDYDNAKTKGDGEDIKYFPDLVEE